MDLVNEIGLRVKAGSVMTSAGVSRYSQRLYKCAFRSGTREHYRDHVGYALWFYENDPFPLMQCSWPDKAGSFPWGEGCSSYVKEMQSLLFAP
jgi:Domain of unknown function (DUF4262)